MPRNKSLISLVKQANLKEVTPRISQQIEQLLKWNFTIHHILGKKNTITDALLSLPWEDIDKLRMPNQKFNGTGGLEEAIEAEMSSSMLSWPGLRMASIIDKEVCRLIQEGVNLKRDWVKVAK